MSLASLFLSLVLASAPAQAKDACADGELLLDTKAIVSEVFEKSYCKERTIYLPAQCGRNVKELLLEMGRQGVSANHFHVLYLLGEYRQLVGGPVSLGDLYPVYSRRNSKSWLFHVVLRYEDTITHESLILDLDGRAHAMPINEYFSFMFPSNGQGDRLTKITSREIDASTYLKAFKVNHGTNDPQINDNIAVGDFRTADLPNSPVIDVRDYLERLHSEKGK